MFVQYLSDKDKNKAVKGTFKPESQYVLVGVLIDTAPPEFKFQVVDEEETVGPAYYPAEFFELIGHDIPAGWVAKKLGETALEICPKEFSGDGFWERFFDDDPSALDIYRSYMKENS